MSEILIHSGIHRSLAYAPPADAEPTSYRTSEESGMKKDQHNTQFTTALLRQETSVDALETKSRCCAAAGIIASTSSSEMLRPHEKLREAATPDTTLTTQHRPPAQPMVGYKRTHSSSMGLLLVESERWNAA
jgi:hypothetical protein